MKAERSRSKGCRTTRKVVAERRNLSLAAGSFDLKVKVAKTLLETNLDLRRRRKLTFISEEKEKPTFIGEKWRAARRWIGVCWWIGT